MIKRLLMVDSEKNPDTQPLRVIDSEEIVDVRFSDATRMPMPERSYAQEQLDILIPLENRIAHLIPYVEPTSELLSAYSIAQGIGAEIHWVQKTAKRIGITTIPAKGTGGADTELYPSLSLELLKEEWQWYQAYNALEDRLTSYAIGKFMARHDSWVERTAADLGIYAEYGRSPSSGLNSFLYPKTLIPQLRHIQLVIPPQEDWLSVRSIAELTGQSVNWVRSRLEKRGFITEERRLYAGGKIFQLYPPESLAYIETLARERPSAAGDWLTVGAMARMLSKTDDWVSYRVKRLYEELGVLREDDTRKTVPHYPPSVLKSLQKEVEQISEFKEAGDYLAASGLARVLGKSINWVQRRLPYIDSQPETRINPANKRPLPYYPPETVEILQALPDDILRSSESAISDN
jgi:hypothetical protein